MNRITTAAGAIFQEQQQLAMGQRWQQQQHVYLHNFPLSLKDKWAPQVHITRQISLNSNIIPTHHQCILKPFGYSITTNTNSD
jgi:hypothetical protein